MTNKMKEFIRTIKYTIIAMSAGLIQVGTDALFYEVFGWSEWVSYLISLALSVVWNFTINRKATFHSTANYGIAMLKVIGYYLVFTPLSTWCVKWLTEAGWNNYLVEFICLFTNFVTEFLFTRFVVYGKQIDNDKKYVAKQNGTTENQTNEEKK